MFPMENVTHLYKKTHEQVKHSHGNEQHFELYIVEVVHFQYFADDWPGIHHQPYHHSSEEQQQEEENHWKR